MPKVAGAYVSALRFAQQDILEKFLDVTSGAAGDLEITLRYGAGTLMGSIQMPDSSNSPGAAQTSAVGSVALLSTETRAEGPLVSYVSSNQDGSFTIKDLKPGTYRAYAFEQMSANNLGNPDLLSAIESLGKEVKIEENGHQQVQLTLIPADSLQSVYARLGLDEN